MHPLDRPRRALATARLRRSFRDVAPHLDRIAERFYALLFARHPEVVPLFARTAPAAQRQKLVASLALALGLADDPRAFDAALRELGHAHAGYGALPAQYPAVVEALLDALADALGAHWTAEVAADWRALLERVSERMIAGHPRPPPDVPPRFVNRD